MIKLLTKIDEMKKDKGLNKMNLKLVKKAPVTEKEGKKDETKKGEEKTGEGEDDEVDLDALNEIFARMSMDTKTKITSFEKFAMIEPNE
jgi:hypothetical protein